MCDRRRAQVAHVVQTEIEVGETCVGYEEGRERSCLLVADVVGGEIEVGEARDLGEECRVRISSAEYEGRIHVRIVVWVCVVT